MTNSLFAFSPHNFGDAMWKLLARNHVVRHQWRQLSSISIPATRHASGVTTAASFHEKAVQRLLDTNKAWDDAMIHQAKQSIQWRTTNQDIPLVAPLVFQDNWRLWESMVLCDSVNRIELELFHFLLHQWRHQMPPSVRAPESPTARQMMDWVQEYARKGILTPDSQTYDLILHAVSLESDELSLETVEWADGIVRRMISQPDDGVYPPPSIVTFATILQLWLSMVEMNVKPQQRSSNFRFLERVEWVESQRVLLQKKGNTSLKANLIYSTSLMNAYALSGQPKECQAIWDQWWDEVERANTSKTRRTTREPPNIQTGTVLLNAWKSDPVRATEVLEELSRLHSQGYLADPPNVISYTIVLDAWAKCKSDPASDQKAEGILREISRRTVEGPNVVSYTTVIDAYAKNGNSTKAQAVFQEMIQQGVAPNTATFNALLFSMSKNDEADQAKDILMAMDQLASDHGWDCHPNAASYTTVLQHYVNQGNAAGAFDVWEHMMTSNVDPDVLTLNILLSALAKVGDVEKAEQAFDLVAHGGPIQPTIVTYTNMMNAWVNHKTGSKSEVLGAVKKYWNEMQQLGISPNMFAYTVLCRCYARFGMGSVALELLNNLSNKKGKGDYAPNVMFYTQVVTALANSAKLKRKERSSVVQRAQAVLNDMIDAGVLPNKFTWSSYLRVIQFSDGQDKRQLAEHAAAWMGQLGTKPNKSLKDFMTRLCKK